jgi:hypothetical protein
MACFYGTSLTLEINVESTAEDRVWHKGPPPFVGWWNASSMKICSLWSWWNGESWSAGVMDDMDETYAATCAVAPNERNTSEIFWSDYYPEDARVPRVNPDVS